MLSPISFPEYCRLRFFFHIFSVTTARPGLLHGWTLLTEVYTKLHLFDDAQEASTKAYKLNQSFGSGRKAINEFLDILAVKFLSKSSNEKNWQAAIDLYLNVNCFGYFFDTD